MIVAKQWPSNMYMNIPQWDGVYFKVPYPKWHWVTRKSPFPREKTPKITHRHTEALVSFFVCTSLPLIYDPYIPDDGDPSPFFPDPDVRNWSPHDLYPIVKGFTNIKPANWRKNDTKESYEKRKRVRVRYCSRTLFQCIKSFRVTYHNNTYSLIEAIDLLLGEDLNGLNELDTNWFRDIFYAVSRVLFRFLRRAAFILKKRRRCAYRVTLFHKVEGLLGEKTNLDLPNDILHNVLNMLA